METIDDRVIHFCAFEIVGNVSFQNFMLKLKYEGGRLDELTRGGVLVSFCCEDDCLNFLTFVEDTAAIDEKILKRYLERQGTY